MYFLGAAQSFLLIFLLIDHVALKTEDDLIKKRINHQHIEIPDHRLSLITRLTDKEHLRRTVKNILIPRVVGSTGHDKVRDFIISSMENLKWTVTKDIFDDRPPKMETRTFENLIAMLNPNAERFLVLACHYDSKYFENEEFLGATDSAVPCAMLINMAYVLKEHLDPVSKRTDLSLMFIFFDGEEAFVEWNAQDSIYGARHLAAKWEKEDFLKRIDMLFLLDLLGTPDPKFYSLFKETEQWYGNLFYAEERLANRGYLENYTTSSAIRSMPSRYFQPQTANAYIEDDHIPFLERDVPILHMIPVPFPDCWHKTTDNHEIIDYNTVENLNKILRIFVVEYLNIEPKHDSLNAKNGSTIFFALVHTLNLYKYCTFGVIPFLEISYTQRIRTRKCRIQMGS